MIEDLLPARTGKRVVRFPMPGRWSRGSSTWDTVLHRLLAEADTAGQVDWSVSVGSTIARAQQHATDITRSTGGWVEPHGSADRAA
ncbi:hypothetical protein [Amycolatopsis sp. NBRC 101858]|uniref:hypothetical protein n=1 Tax=Amycolatopsis sp. NBRC 101858 TaxID=3032200 RepID=UPI002552F377|nr:hypothetical protein [Amycolatopsis sp. NBRC 101858]